MKSRIASAAAVALVATFGALQAFAQPSMGGGMGGMGGMSGMGGSMGQGMMGQGSMGQGAMGQPAAQAMADGEVRKVDKEAGKLTLRHGPIAQLDMPAMTMVYRVKEPAMLDQVRAGDKIRFSAEKDAGALTVTRIEPAN